MWEGVCLKFKFDQVNFEVPGRLQGWDMHWIGDWEIGVGSRDQGVTTNCYLEAFGVLDQMIKESVFTSVW